MKMKKYLMTGIAALALCVGFTSCSKDLEQLSQEEINELEAKKIVDNYNKAFKAYIGGEIASTQTWGFGIPEETRTRAFTPTHLSSTSSWLGWVSAPSDEDFAADYPDDIIPADQYYNYTNQVRKNYKLSDNEEETINFWLGNAEIFVKGKKSLQFNNPGDGSPGITFHILKDADVTFKSDFNYQKSDNFAMYIDPEAKVTFNGDLSANVRIYNRGTVVVKGITGPYHNGAIYNDKGGIITCEKNLSVFNDNSQVINDGTITVAKGMTIEGSGHFRNAEDGNITVTGLTFVNSNDCSWINDGVFTTDNYTYHAGSTDVINNCMLKVNQKFEINLMDTDKNCFLMNGGAGVEAGSFHFNGPGFIYMGSGSVFKVLGNATMDATKINYGFYGPKTGAPAVLHVVGNIVTSNIKQRYDITYGNNIAVVCTDHFDSNTGYTSNDGEAVAGPIIGFDNCTRDIIYTAGSKPSITIAKGKCNPGFEGGPKPETWSVCVMAEDLSATEASDFDFNDVVFDVEYTKGQSTATITLRAAGGTLPLRVNSTNGVGGFEVHDAFGGYPTTTMINTGWTGSNGANNVAPAVRTIENFSATDEASFLAAVKAIRIEVRKALTTGGYQWFEMTAEQGEPASKFAVPVGTTWCSERTSISGERDNFAAWARTGQLDFKWW